MSYKNKNLEELNKKIDNLDVKKLKLQLKKGEWSRIWF